MLIAEATPLPIPSTQHDSKLHKEQAHADTFMVRFSSDAWMLTSSAEPMAPPAHIFLQSNSVYLGLLATGN